MTKNKITALICLSALIIGIALGIWLPSRQNLNAKSAGSSSVSVEGDGIEFVSGDGTCKIIIPFSGEYVSHLKICGETGSLPTEASVASAESRQALDTAETETITLEKLGDDLYLTLNENISFISIEFAVNDVPEISSVVFNPTNLIFDFPSVFIWGFGLMLIAGVLAFAVLLRGSYKAYITVFGKYRYLVANLISRDLKVKYRRSVLGFLWSILNPLLMALVINAVFQNLFRFDIEYFIVYYLTGSLLFNFMTEATTNSLTSVIYASSLIKKVYIPKYIFPLEKCMFAFVNMLFSSFAVIIVIIIKRMPVHLTILMFFFPMICVLIFSLGLSLILASVNVFFRDIGHLYTVWTVAWMYLTPIIYPASILPNSIAKIMQLNPMYYYVTYFRDVVMYGTLPSLATHLICIIYAFIFLALGLLIFKKQQDKFILYI